MKKYFLNISILFILLGLLQCSDNKTINNDRNKPQFYVKYYQEKKIVPVNDFKYIDVVFENEIIGTYDEVIQSLKTIKKLNKGYFKVYYDINTHSIVKYEYYYQGILMSYAEYIYGLKNDPNSGKLISVNYYDEKLKLIAIDEISYNDFGRPVQTHRYKMPGKKRINIF